MDIYMPLRVSAGSILSTLRAHCSLKFSATATATNHHTISILGWHPLHPRQNWKSSLQFFRNQRCVVANSKPNIGHYALAMLQQQCENEGKHFTIITQNIDELHWKAGSKDVVELHGSLWKTQCCRCNDVQDNYEKAVCPALDGKGAPDEHTKDAQIPVAELPHCRKCNGLLRPHVVWFGERLDPTVLDRAKNALIECDLLLVVGTSAVVQPAAGFAPIVQGGGGVVAEFNIEDTPISRSCRFKFHGPSAKTLPQALGMSPEDLAKHKSEESN